MIENELTPKQENEVNGLLERTENIKLDHNWQEGFGEWQDSASDVAGDPYVPAESELPLGVTVEGAVASDSTKPKRKSLQPSANGSKVIRELREEIEEGKRTGKFKNVPQVSKKCSSKKKEKENRNMKMYIDNNVLSRPRQGIAEHGTFGLRKVFIIHDSLDDRS